MSTRKVRPLGAVWTTLRVAVSANLSRTGRGETAVGALRWPGRQGGSFGAEPFARGLFDFGAIFGTEIGEGSVEDGVALAGGFRNQVPFQALDLVLRHAHAIHQHMRKTALRATTALAGGIA